MADVQQVRVRNKVKNTDWAEQDEIRKAAQAGVEKANEANVELMRHE